MTQTTASRAKSERGLEAGASPSAKPWTYLLVSLSATWTLLVVVAMLVRASYPLELEWMEGGSLHQARRLLDGDPIYATPSSAFVPFLYTPLYPALVALGGAVFGLSFGLARAISILATLASAWAIWSIVGQEQRSRVHQACAVGLFFSGYVFAFRWLDLARADATFLAFAIWSLYFLRRSDLQRSSPLSWRLALVAGVLMALAFWTKQTASLFVVAGGVWTLAMPRRSLLAFGVTIAVIDGVGVVLGQAMTEGWLWTYIYELHQSHEFNRIRFTQKTWGMLVHAAPWLSMLLAWRSGVAAHSWWRGRSGSTSAQADESLVVERRRGVAFWSWMFAAALLACALGYSTQWAEPNAFVPGVAFGAIICTLVAPQVLGAQWSGRFAAGLIAAQMSFALAFEAQYQPIQDQGLAGLAQSYKQQDPWRTIPSAEKFARANALHEWIVDEGAGLWAPQRPWWSSMGGGPGHVSSMGLNDVSKAERGALRRQIRDELSTGRYTLVWIEGSLASWTWLRPTLARHFRLAERRLGDERVLPMTGFMSQAGMVRAYTAPQLMLERSTPPSVPAGWISVAEFEEPRDSDFTLEGSAFRRGPVASIHLNQPAVGPISGLRYLSSAASNKGLRAKGRAIGPTFVLPAKGGTLHLLAARSGEGRSVSLRIEQVAGDRGTSDQASAAASSAVPQALLSETLELTRRDWGLVALEWRITPSWSGKSARLVVEDDDEDAAVFVDAVRIEP